MLVLSVVQVAVIASVMTLSGEFEYIRMFSYNSVREKTGNRRSYVENLLGQKTALVYETSFSVNGAAEKILSETGKTFSDIKNDKSIGSRILEESVQPLISLLRRDMVNDAFIILDSPDEQSGGLNALYFRDTDVNENSVSDYSDIFLEAGSAELSKEYGFPLDYGWTRYITEKDGNLDFFRKTIDGHETNPKKQIYNLGLWSPFSVLVKNEQESMRYSLPLVSPDGTVYGVIGIGLLKKTVLGAIPVTDFSDDSACYILGADLENKGSYDIILSSGSAFGRLVDENTVLDNSRKAGYGLCYFTSKGGESFGSIQALDLYASGSPYRNQKWALISVADKEKTLHIYTNFMKIFIFSVALTLAAGAFMAYLLSRSISRPISDMVKGFEESRKNNTPVKLDCSGVAEIDSLAEAAAELQAGALEYGSRVSRIITMAGGKFGVFLYDVQSRTVFVAENLSKLLDIDGFRDKEITVSFEEFGEILGTVDKENRILSLDIFNDETILQQNSPEIEHDGRWFEFSLARDGKNVVGLVQDITDTVEEKENIAKNKDDEYTSKLLEANRTLSDAYAMAKRANNAKTDFLSRMSHDIRTPMNAIIGMTAIAKANIDKKEKLIDCFDKIESSEKYLLSIINEVLDMSKIESGKFVLSEEKFNITELSESIAEIIRPDAAARGHELSLGFGEIEHRFVKGDEVRLKQALMNVISNAVKYTPNGGKIEFYLSEKPVNQQKVGMYEFIVRDNGIGMSEEFMKNLYEPFERASDIRTSKEMGTGLGMAITKNIVEMMDGEITVWSEQGKGSVFTIRVFLKLSKSAENRDESGVSTENADFSGKKILLVEDNELNREIACDILGMMNLTVCTAENGSEAVEMFSSSAENEYELIIMDVQMPIMNGYEASMAIRRSKRSDSDVPIIAMTANAFAEDVRDAKNAGMNEHIAKPLDLEKLTLTLKKYLGNSN